MATKPKVEERGNQESLTCRKCGNRYYLATLDPDGLCEHLKAERSEPAEPEKGKS